MSKASVRELLKGLTPGEWVLSSLILMIVASTIVGASFNGFTGAYRTGGMAVLFSIAILLVLLGVLSTASTFSNNGLGDEDIGYPLGGFLIVVGMAFVLLGLGFCNESTQNGEVAVMAGKDDRYSTIGAGSQFWNLAPPWFPQERIRYEQVGFNAKMRQATESGELFDVRIWVEAAPDQELFYERLAAGTSPEKLASFAAVSVVSQEVVSRMLEQPDQLLGRSDEDLTEEFQGFMDDRLRQYALRPKFFRILSLEKVHSG